MIRRKAENKTINAGGDAGANYDGAFTLMNGLVQGTAGADNRIGQQIRMQKLFFNCYCRADSTATVPQAVRVMIVYDKATNQATPVNAQFWDQMTSAAAVCGNLERTKEKDYEVLYDTMIEVGTYSASHVLGTGSNPCRQVEINMKDKLTCYDTGNAGTVSDITSGALWLWVISSASAASPSVYWDHKLTFTDC